MSSTFGTYSIAHSGMYVNQAALTVISQDLANVNTSGYSRKQLTSGETVSGSTGTGVTIEKIQRARETLLDTSYRTANSTSEYWNTKSGTMEYVQQVLADYEADDDTGLLTAVQDFFDSWETLSTDTTSSTSRESVVDYAQTLIETLSSIDEELQSVQASLVSSAESMVGSINDIADQLADLNQQITVAEAGGSEASDLRDTRDALLDDLSTYTSITTQEMSNGSVTVYIGGSALVSGANANHLSITGDGSTDNPLTVEWGDSDKTVTITDGSLKALLEDADQSGYTDITNTSTYNYTASSVSSIANMRQALNDLVTTIATTINSIHTTGTGIDSDSTTGINFFVTVDASKPLSISNIQVNSEIVNDVTKLAAGTSGGSDNTLALEIASLTDTTDSSSKIFQFDGLSENVTQFYTSLISWVGTEGSSYSSNYDTKNAVVTSIDNQRQEISSVSLDEEMSNMIKYQNAYSASAMVLSTIDSMVGSMIDELGSRAGV